VPQSACFPVRWQAKYTSYLVLAIALLLVWVVCLPLGTLFFLKRKHAGESNLLPLPALMLQCHAELAVARLL
jgi:uncharacterized membrane protein YfbV (UPF0208 family)